MARTVARLQAAVSVATQSPAVVYGAALALAGLHTWAVWGYTGLFWGDHGRWLHEVERFADGQVPYRDFQWHFPPAGLWLVGGAARLVGTSVAAVSAVTTSMFFATVVTFVSFVRRIVPEYQLPVTIAGLIFAFAYADNGGVPAPLGLYTPAALVGFLFTIGAGVATLRLVQAPSNAAVAALAGVMEGLCVLSKQDYWAPAALLFAIGIAASLQRRQRAVALAQLATVAATVAAGAAVIAVTAGARTLIPLLGGFGHLEELGGRGLPSWERLTVEVASGCWVAAAWAFGICVVCRVKHALHWSLGLLTIGLLAVTLHLTMSIAAARDGTSEGRATATKLAMSDHPAPEESLVRQAARSLKERMRHDPIPILLPAALLAVVLIRRQHWLDPRRRELTAALLALWLSARLRRGFEGTEWFDFLLGLPAGVLVIEWICQRVTPFRRRALLMLGLWATVAVGMAEYRVSSRGRLSHRILPAFETERGTVHWSKNAVNDYRRLRAALNAVDSSGQRPLFAFGYAGGFSYFLDRVNPAPVTQDFFFSNFPAADVVRSISAAQPAVFLLDNPYFRGGFPPTRIDWRHWEPVPRPSVYETFDRPLFDALLARCRRVDPSDEPRAFKLYDCAPE